MTTSMRRFSRSVLVAGAAELSEDPDDSDGAVAAWPAQPASGSAGPPAPPTAPSGAGAGANRPRGSREGRAVTGLLRGSVGPASAAAEPARGGSGLRRRVGRGVGMRLAVGAPPGISADARRNRADERKAADEDDEIRDQPEPASAPAGLQRPDLRDRPAVSPSSAGSRRRGWPRPPGGRSVPLRAVPGARRQPSVGADHGVRSWRQAGVSPAEICCARYWGRPTRSIAPSWASK